MKEQKHGKFKRREERFLNPNRDESNSKNFKKYIVTPDSAKFAKRNEIRAKRMADLARIKGELNPEAKDKVKLEEVVIKKIVEETERDD